MLNVIFSKPIITFYQSLLKHIFTKYGPQNYILHHRFCSPRISQPAQNLYFSLLDFHPTVYFPLLMKLSLFFKDLELILTLTLSYKKTGVLYRRDAQKSKTLLCIEIYVYDNV